MRINTYKNYIGLCACKGCYKRIKVKIEVKDDLGDGWGTVRTKQRFWLCHNCISKLFGLE